MSSMKFIVTGNLGYVGSVLVPHLRATHPMCEIVGVDAGYFAGCLIDPERFPEYADGPTVDRQYFEDIRHLSPFMLDELDNTDAIIHLAAISNDPMGEKWSVETMEVNHQATLALARQAVDRGVRSFVFASSCSVYGATEKGRVCSEGSTTAPLTTYALSKRLAEQGLELLANDPALVNDPTGGMQVTCLRFGTACGPSPRLRLDLVLNDFVASAVYNHEVKLLSDGQARRPLIDVRDMARALEWAATARPRDNGEPDYLVVNVGREDWNWKIRDLAEAVAALVPQAHVHLVPGAKQDARSYLVSFLTYSLAAPAHQPIQSLSSTILGLVTMLRDADLEFALEGGGQDFRQGRFCRLPVLSRLRKGAGR